MSARRLALGGATLLAAPTLVVFVLLLVVGSDHARGKQADKHLTARAYQGRTAPAAERSGLDRARRERLEAEEILGAPVTEDGRRLVAELPELRTRTSRTYVDETGEYVARIAPGSLNFSDEHGRWTKIDNKLVAVEGGYRNRSNRFVTRLPSLLSDSVRVERDGLELAFRLRGASGSAQIRGATARYAEALPDVDVEYTAQADALKEDLILRSPSATREFVFDLDVSSGAALVESPGGGLHARSADGARRFELSRPVMSDAAGDVSHAVQVSVQRTGDRWTVRLVPDRAWLDSPGRAWPVTIDPPVSPQPTRDCTISRDTTLFWGGGWSSTYGGDCTSSALTVGGMRREPIHDRIGWDRAWRSLLHFDVRSILPADADVQTASLGAYLHSGSTAATISAIPVETAWTSAVTWSHADNGRPWTNRGGDLGLAADSQTVGGTNGVGRYYRWNLSALTRNWQSGAKGQHGVLLYGPEGYEGGSTGTETPSFDTLISPSQFTFGSIESANPATRPYLEIQYALETTPPTLTLSGSLFDAAGTVLQPGDYDLTAVADDGAAPASGVARMEMYVDGVLTQTVDTFTETCGTPTCRRHTFAYTGDAFTPDLHEVEVRAIDGRGNTSSRKVFVYGNQELSTTASAVGFEDHFALRSLATGAGSTAFVNLSSGNFTWHHRPVENAGRGLDTNVDITYNSLSTDLDLGHGYDEIGEGFSLAISSLTRVNEALDVRAAEPKQNRPGMVTLTDADGTMHRFTQPSATATWYDPPAGVNLRLRKYYVSPTTDAQREKVWAATTPDGVTHFFDACGYQRSVEDRNGNVLRFEYDPVPPSEEDCHRPTQSVRPKLRRVIDATGVDGSAPAASRTLSITYAQEQGGGEGPSRIETIRDHGGRVLTFTYHNEKKRLATVTEATGTAQARTFRFEYEQTGARDGDKDLNEITDPLGRKTSVLYSDDLDHDSARAPKFGLGERVARLTDRAGRFLQFDYDPGSPYQTTTVIDRRSKSWTYRTDGGARLREMVDPLGTLTQYEWDPDNNPGRITEAAGALEQAATVMIWNTNGRLVRITDPEQRTTTLEYDNHPGVLPSPTGADAGETYVSDLRKVTTPRNTTMQYDYRVAADPALEERKGNLRVRTDGDGYVTRWEYTARGLVSREERETNRAEFAVTQYQSFDPSGLPRLIIDPRSQSWRVHYDAVGLVTDITDPRSSTAPTPGAVREPYTTEYIYDALDRQTAVRIPKLSSANQWLDRATGYDLNDNVTQSTDGTGAITRRFYTVMDDVDRIESPAVPHEGETGSASEVTAFGYDEEQNLTRVESPRGRQTATVDDAITAYTYDAAGRRTVERRMSRGATSKDLITSWDYDRRGNVIGVADPRRNATGGDPANNAKDPVKRRFTYVYDLADNRRFSIEDPAGQALKTELQYDANDNLIAEIDPRAFEPNPTKSYKTTYEYDGRDLLKAAVDAEGGRTEYERRGDGRLVRLLKPNGSATATVNGDFETRFDYFPTGELRERTIPRASGQYGDPLPWRIVYTRNAVGDPTEITDGRGHSFTNTFFDTGDLRTTDRPSWWELAGEELVERDPEAQMRGEGTEDEETTQPGVDAQGDFGNPRQHEQAGPLPRAGLTRLEYDNEMRLALVRDVSDSTSDPEDYWHKLERDALGRVGTTRSAFDGATKIIERFGYDRNGNLAARTNGESHKTQLVYDQFDRVERELAPGETTTTVEETVYGYDENDNVLTVQTPRGPNFIERMQYDALDRLTSEANPAGEKTTWEDFDGAGNPRLETPPRGNVAGLDPATRATFGIRRTFDALDRVTKVQNGLGHETFLTYDADSNVVRVDEPGSRASSGGAIERRLTRMTYDGRDLPWATTTGAGTHARSTLQEFDPNGNLRRVVKPSGVQQLDENRWAARWVDTGGAPSGQPDATRHATVHEYNEHDLLIHTHQPWGARTPEDAFDQNSRRYVQDFERDQRGRIQTINAPHTASDTIGESARTRYTHFDNGWIKTGRDPELIDGDRVYQHEVGYAYDKRGFQTEWISKIRGETRRTLTRTFAPNGTMTRRRATHAGTTRTYDYTYNANHTLTSIAEDDPSRDTQRRNRLTWIRIDAAERPRIFDEDRDGNINTRGDGRDTTLEYDAGGNVTRRQTDGHIEPDPADPANRDRYLYQDGRTTAFTYDPIDRELATATCRDAAVGCSTSTPDARVTRTEWFDSGDLATRTKWNNVRESRFYFNDGRLARMVRTAPSGAERKNQSYSYDTAGNRTRDERGQHAFSARDTLIRWTRNGGGSNVDYNLAGSGNIEAVSDSAATGVDIDYEYFGDRLERATYPDIPGATADYDYNDFGGLRSIEQVFAGTTKRTEYIYDEFERLTEAKGFGVPAADRGDRYCYDAFDRRDFRIEGNASATCTDHSQTGVTTREYSYIGLTNRLSREEASDGKTRTYDYDSYYDALGRGQREGTEQPVFKSYAHDANGSIEGLESTNGESGGNEYRFDPYGTLLPSSGVADPRDPGQAERELGPEAQDNPLRFEGFYYDKGINAYDMHARHYRPDIGRFLTQDRYEDTGADIGLQLNPNTINRYAFAGGNPIDNVEFDGHEPPDSFNDCYPGSVYCSRPAKAKTPKARRRGKTIQTTSNVIQAGIRNRSGPEAQPKQPESSAPGPIERAVERVPVLNVAKKLVETANEQTINIKRNEDCPDLRASCQLFSISDNDPKRAAVEAATLWPGGRTARGGASLLERLSRLAKTPESARSSSTARRTLAANEKSGRTAEHRIARAYPGSTRQVTLQTASGARRIDVLTSTGRAIESKVGRTSLTRDVRRQIRRDLELLSDPSSPVRSVEWRFSTSPRTGRVGPTGPLEQRLRRTGIRIVYDP